MSGEEKPQRKPRAGVTKKVRFEVFKRDAFTCQYCGHAAPEAVLRVDHIHPVSQGGADDLLNLITACFDCNAGKSDRPLSDGSAVAKQRAQLELLNERREQLEMLLQWRDGMADLDEQALEAFAARWSEIVPGYYLNEVGRNNAKKLIRKHGLQKCLDALGVAHNYVELQADGKATKESAELAFKKLGGIMAMQDRPPDERKMYYVKGILRNRFSYVNHAEAMRLMRDVSSWGGSMEYVERCAKECRNWTDWNSEMQDYIDDLERGQG